MKLSLAVQLFVAALYNECQATGHSEFKVGDILDRYSIKLDPMWRDRFLNDGMLNDLLAVSRHIGPVEEQRVSMSTRGVRWIEDEFGENIAHFLEQHGAFYNQQKQSSNYVEDGYVEEGYLSEPLTSVSAPIVDSANWTGTQHVLVDAKTIKAVRDAANDLKTAVYSMHFSSNSEADNLHKLVDALVSICDMAEPEVTIIDRILASPKFKAYVGLLTFVATVRGALGI